jgi:alkanesulfonate monooxygenase SsuD/methylene tetrahydromethanopterin reductase-like flavin-dependent oxidoreductase (luciferase family)
MQLGYSITSAYAREVSPDEAMNDLLARAERAATAGIDYVQVGDHHAMSDHYLQNVPTAGRLGGVFDGLASLFLLPLYDPIFVAEYCGTLGTLVDSFDAWCTVGWRDEEFQAFGVPKAERAPRFEESIEVIRGLWREDDFSFDGQYYSVDGVSVNPKADARVCVGGSAQPAVRRAGRLGDAWVGHPGVEIDDLETMIGWFEDAGGGDVIIRRDALCRTDGDRAREEAETVIMDGYRGWPEDADWGLVGDAADIAEQLEAYREIGVEEVVVRPIQNSAETLEVVAGAGEYL